MPRRKQTEAKIHGYPHADIRHEVLLQILSKLPIKTLMKFRCVCKLWSESIVNDPRFIEAHFLESQKNPILMFKYLPKELDHMERPYSFLREKEEYRTNHLFYLEKDEFVNGTGKVLHNVLNLIASQNSSPRRLIGYCNGLVCFMVGVPYSSGCWSYFVVEIFNFSKLEKLRIVSRIPTPPFTSVGDCRFGYDVLAKEYKLMCILLYIDDEDEVYNKYIILTIGGSGTQSWRKIKHPMTMKGHPRSPGRCIDGALFWVRYDTDECKKVLISFDLHDEKFQVINLPTAGMYFPEYDHQLEYKRCFCYASVKKPDTRSGAVELHILKDRIQQVWETKIITFDLPDTVRNPPAAPCYDFKGLTFSLSEEGITSIRIVEFDGRIYLYWRNMENEKGSHIIQFYDLESKKLTEVEGPTGGKCGKDYHVANHVENLVSLKAWTTHEGDGGGVLLGRNFDTGTSKKIEDMFKQMPASTTDGEMVSYFSSLSFSGKNKDVLLVI
ncbi:putative F-box protein At1g47790 [Papaver somniferum]|uniref:putative F-box protein At1g47790 n=1 Tax=Papaver somniferum TaxID=3469 RepID=UPI000E6FC2EC|nr:putative F-box protein At1g47790 [Papaver somniferum]